MYVCMYSSYHRHHHSSMDVSPILEGIPKYSIVIKKLKAGYMMISKDNTYKYSVRTCTVVI